jgi:hypothetical protein
MNRFAASYPLIRVAGSGFWGLLARVAAPSLRRELLAASLQLEPEQDCCLGVGCP